MPIQSKQQPPYYTTSAEQKILIANISQLGTAAPTLTIFHNTIGTITWARVDTGHYTGTKIQAFPKDKTQVKISPNSLALFSIENPEDGEPSDRIDIKTWEINGTPSDEMLYNTAIEITIHP